MALRIWLLVEWVDETNVLPTYGVVNVNTLSYSKSDLHPGHEIFIRVHRGGSRRAKIIRMSESKRYLYEHRERLERQDQQVKNVLQICMRTIRDVKANDLSCGVQYNRPPPGLMGLPEFFQTSSMKSESGSGSDSDAEPNRYADRSNHSLNRSRHYPKYGRKAPKIPPLHDSLHSAQTRRSSFDFTEEEEERPQRRARFDAANQAERLKIARKVVEMEALLKDMYKRFKQAIGKAHASNDSTSNDSSSDSELNNDVSCEEQEEMNDSEWTEATNTDYEDQVQEPNNMDVEDELVIDQNVGNVSLNNSTSKEDRATPNALRVRRMSAQTTNNIETPPKDADLVPIGEGNTKVPARLLNEINWSSHTIATRQLLQAVFPRRVLATHCLTGKQSPAFMNRPPKKILDPKLVEDIVKIVSTRCGVPKSLVRNSITIKCTDEAKLYRNRLQYKLQRRIHDNDENRPPSIPSSDDSSNNIMA